MNQAQQGQRLRARGCLGTEIPRGKGERRLLLTEGPHSSTRTTKRKREFSLPVALCFFFGFQLPSLLLATRAQVHGRFMSLTDHAPTLTPLPAGSFQGRPRNCPWLFCHLVCVYVCTGDWGGGAQTELQREDLVFPAPLAHTQPPRMGKQRETWIGWSTASFYKPVPFFKAPHKPPSQRPRVCRARLSAYSGGYNRRVR